MGNRIHHSSLTSQPISVWSLPLSYEPLDVDRFWDQALCATEKEHHNEGEHTPTTALVLCADPEETAKQVGEICPRMAKSLKMSRYENSRSLIY